MTPFSAQPPPPNIARVGNDNSAEQLQQILLAYAEWVYQQFREVQASFDTVQEFVELIEDPNAIEAGLFRADGTGWDPGSGAGLYYFDGTTTWTKLA